jgi:hypothetical protein
MGNTWNVLNHIGKRNEYKYVVMIRKNPENNSLALTSMTFLTFAFDTSTMVYK